MKNGCRHHFIKAIQRILIILILALPPGCSNTQATDVQLNGNAQVYFSPHGGATEAIVEEIEKAKSEILVQAYSFTSKEIAQALIGAHKRGVHIELVLDKSNRSDRYSAGDFAAHMGIRTYIDAEHQIAHNKIMIIDRTIVITGSFNFTRAAEEKNAENLLIIRSKELATLYIENWNAHRRHSEEYEGRH